MAKKQRQPNKTAASSADADLSADIVIASQRVVDCVESLENVAADGLGGIENKLDILIALMQKVLSRSV